MAESEEEPKRTEKQKPAKPGRSFKLTLLVAGLAALAAAAGVALRGRPRASASPAPKK